MKEPHPWKRAIVWTLFLGPFFFASYGLANWLASRRTDVGSIVFSWEHSIPFLAWTIVPYWSIDLLYAVSILACTTRRELDTHAVRLFAAQIISVACFILFPLRFSFDRPETSGVFGDLFTLLGSFDKPFNQAPSLHIALLVLIWSTLARHVSARWRWLLHAWMIVIGLSVLTTYQHHFIDIPTGVLAGAAVLWALPEGERSPLASMKLASDRKRRRLALYYAAGSIGGVAMSIPGGAWLWMLWPAISLALVSLFYLAIGERGFQKSASGRLSTGAMLLLTPYVAGAWINSRIWTRKYPHPSEVTDGVWVGRIPTAAELRASRFAAVIDLSAELPCRAPDGVDYASVPVLDLIVPSEDALRRAAAGIEKRRERGEVLVCCALGYSRSASAVVAWLLTTSRARDFESARRTVQQARPTVVLTEQHGSVLAAIA